MTVKGISDIVYRLGLKPDVKNYFDQLIRDSFRETQACHWSYEYPTEVQNQGCWRHLGVFYDYLIRREIYALQGRDAFDHRADIYEWALWGYGAEIIEYNQEVYEVVEGVRISINHENIYEVEDLLNSYEIFKNTYRRTENVLKHIFKTSMLQMMSYGGFTVRYDPYFLNWYNIKDVLGFVRSWDLQGIDINPTVRGRFFIGDADLIFYDSIMDIKLSKYEPEENWSKFKLGIYQIILYALGYFIQTGQERRKFEVYNPLLGKMYILELPCYLDFEELREVVDNEPCWRTNPYSYDFYSY